MNQQSHYFWSVTSRVIAAVIGGYCCCIAANFALIPILNIAFNMPIPDSVYLATILSYLFYVTFIVWSFCPKTALLAWRDIFIFNILCGFIYILAMPKEGFSS